MYTVRDPAAFDAKPELGMGYHFGVVPSSPEAVIVLNATYTLTPDEILNADRFVGLLRSLGDEHRSAVVVTGVAARPPEQTIVPSEDVKLFKASFGHLISNIAAYESRTMLHTSPPFPFSTTSPAALVRFSAFRNDRRVRPDRSLLPGSYVTSDLDAGFAPSGFAVVGRYALPNMLPAVYRFDVAVPPGITGLVGTVAPAFGQAGGGAEIELTGGSTPGSVTGPLTIPTY